MIAMPPTPHADFIDLLGQSSVTYIRDLREYGWNGGPRRGFAAEPGWEAISPTGEIRSSTTWTEAQAWRVAECRQAAGL